MDQWRVPVGGNKVVARRRRSGVSGPTRCGKPCGQKGIGRRQKDLTCRRGGGGGAINPLTLQLTSRVNSKTVVLDEGGHPPSRYGREG